MTWALLIYTNETESNPELLADHKALQHDLVEGDALHLSARLHDRSEVVESWRVTSNSQEELTTDLPYLETREWLVGFYVVEGSKEDAIQVDAQFVLDNALDPEFVF